MKSFYGLGSPTRMYWHLVNKSFNYLRSNHLIRRVYWGKYTITEKGIQVLYDTLLKRQRLGSIYEVMGVCLIADPDTKQIIVKSVS